MERATRDCRDTSSTAWVPAFAGNAELGGRGARYV